MKFRTMFTAEMPEPYIGTKSIYSTYQEVPPYATDPETGEVLNSSSRIKRVKTGEYDFQEYIQSFADSCSLSALLARVKSTGDMSLLKQSNPEIGDELPSDPAELRRLSEQVDTVNAALQKIESEQKAKNVISGLSDSDLDQLLSALEARTKKEG